YELAPRQEGLPVLVVEGGKLTRREGWEISFTEEGGFCLLKEPRNAGLHHFELVEGRAVYLGAVADIPGQAPVVKLPRARPRDATGALAKEVKRGFELLHEAPAGREAAERAEKQMARLAQAEGWLRQELVDEARLRWAGLARDPAQGQRLQFQAVLLRR